MRRGLQAALALLVILAACVAARAEQVRQLKPQGYVSDFAGVIDSGTREKLTALCQEVNQKANAQIAVVTVHTISGTPLDEFSIDLAEKWGVGPKTNDRGVMILLVVNDHKYRIEVGYGLEGVLPDGLVGRIGREAVPLLRQSNYNGALLLMTTRVAQAIAAGRNVKLSTAPALPAASSGYGQPSGIPIGTILSLLLFFGFPALGWLLPLLLSGSISNPRRRGYVGRRPWIVGGYWPGTFMGGGFGGGGGMGWGGGGGFGGFGGGSFGGGGASGSW